MIFCRNTCLLLLLLAGNACAETVQQWAVRALQLQEQIDIDAPLNHSFWVGTHNSYAARGDGFIIDPNQDSSLMQQLRDGAREIVFDIYWHRDDFYLCHGKCMLGKRALKAGLSDIRKFLSAPKSYNVILLKIEADQDSLDGRFDQLAAMLENELAGLIYSVKDYSDGSQDQCDGLVSQSISKRRILDTGRRVLVMTNAAVNDSGETVCLSSDVRFNQLVWQGVTYPDGRWQQKLTKLKAVEDCEALERQGIHSDFTRAFDSRTWRGLIASKENRIRKDEMRRWQACGLNIFEVYNYNGAGGQGEDASGTAGRQAREFVWSWSEAAHSPGVRGECAALQSSDNRITDYRCDRALRASCRQATNTDPPQWNITALPVLFESAEHACNEEFGEESTFAMIRNPWELELLKAARDQVQDVDINHTNLWVNYRISGAQWTTVVGKQAGLPSSRKSD